MLYLLRFRNLSDGAVLPFDAEREAARGRAVHLNVVRFGVGEKLCDCWFVIAFRDVFERKKTAAFCIGFKRSRTVAQCFRKLIGARVAFTTLLMNVHRARLR